MTQRCCVVSRASLKKLELEIPHSPPTQCRIAMSIGSSQSWWHKLPLVSGPPPGNCASRDFWDFGRTKTQKKLYGREKMPERSETIRIGGHEVKVTRPDKVLF